jgi:hypothetical protein
MPWLIIRDTPGDQGARPRAPSWAGFTPGVIAVSQGRAPRLALGTGFGGNGTAGAASASVAVIGIAARTGHLVSFWKFTRHGIVVTASIPRPRRPHLVCTSAGLPGV